MNKKEKIWISFMEYGHRIGCHQTPTRSFFLNGYQFPVCARCTGVILGEIIAVMLILLGIRFNIVISIFLLLIMGFDWFIQFIKILQSNNATRLITGVTGGIGLTYIYYYLLFYIIEVVKNFFNKY